MAGVSKKIKEILDFIMSPLEGGRYGEDVFDEVGSDFETDYPTDANAALNPEYKAQPMPKKFNKDNVRVLSSRQANYEVAVFEPKAYNESVQIAEALKERKTIILNLQLLEREESQRIVDFLCGCTHALDGGQRKIGEFVFIFTPSNVCISQEVVNSKLSRDAIWTQHQA